MSITCHDEVPVIRLINKVLSEAVSRGASDVHIIPTEHKLSVQCHIDGVVDELLTSPKQIADQVIARIKEFVAR